MTLAGAALALGLFGATAHAQAPRPTAPAGEEGIGRSARELDALLGRLTDGTAARRRAAADEIIAGIEADDVPAVRERLLARWRFDPMQLRIQVIRAIRAATGNRPNATYDLLAVTLAAPRTPDLDRYIERIVLARGLAREPSVEGGRALLALAANYDGVSDPFKPFNEDVWELYHVAEDFSECHDLAAEMPEKLREMIDRWWAEAGRYDVLPLGEKIDGLNHFADDILAKLVD